MPQYIEEKEVDYLRHSNKTILSLVAHLRMWPVITNTEMMATNAAFIAPWSDSPDEDLSAYARYLTTHQNNAKKYEVNTT